jgi:hypothetical protein
VLTWALKLVGHDVSHDIKSFEWVASSFSGQVFMPRILLGDEFRQIGFACLWFSQGILMLESQNDRPFSRILSSKERKRPGRLYDNGEYHHRISAQLNIHHQEKLNWQLVNKVDYLELIIDWTRDPTRKQPLRILLTLQESVMLVRYKYQVSTQAPPDEAFRCYPQGLGISLLELYNRHLNIIPFCGNEEVKLLALASMERELGIPKAGANGSSQQGRLHQLRGKNAVYLSMSTSNLVTKYLLRVWFEYH